MGTRSRLDPAEEAGDVRSGGARAALGDECPARRVQARRHQRAVKDGAVHLVLEQRLLPPHLGTHTLPAISRLCRFSLSRVLTS